jgi:hypothetical protein
MLLNTIMSLVICSPSLIGADFMAQHPKTWKKKAQKRARPSQSHIVMFISPFATAFALIPAATNGNG